MWRDFLILPFVNEHGEIVLTWFKLRHAIHNLTGEPLPMNLRINNQWCDKTLDGPITRFDLSQHDAHLNVDIMKSTNEMHAFHYAAKWGNVDAMRKWLVAGLPINFADEDGLTAMMHAASEDKIAVVQSLLRYGADMNVMDEKNQTALMWAVHGGATECLKFLLDSGAIYNDANNMNTTPLMQAAYYEYYPTFSLIAQKYYDDGLMTREMFERLEQLHRYQIIRDYYDVQQQLQYRQTHNHVMA
jgi:ankyrin repeat protein